jgi:hypothetical protein
MQDRFEIRRAGGGTLARLPPIADGRFDLASFRKVMRQQFRLRCGRLWEALLQDVSDATVKLLAPALEQGRIGYILDQGVLEAVGRLGRRAAAED